MSNIKTVYHGANKAIEIPDFSYANPNSDFGKGFYLTESYEMASQWATHKNPSIVNQYELDFSNLKICHLELDKTWLNYVAKNRGYLKTTFNDSKYDVIIGPTADNNLKFALSKYVQGECTAKEALKQINGRKLSEQILIRTDNAKNQLKHLGFSTLSEQEKEQCLNHEKESEKAAAKFVLELSKTRNTPDFPEYISLNKYEEDFTLC